MTVSLEQIALRQWQDYQARDPGRYFAGPPDDLDLGQAYGIQAAVARLRVGGGDRVVGYKVGCTGPGTIGLFGMAGPIRGTLYRSEVRASGALLDPRAHASLAIEGEMALRIGDDGRPVAAFPVIELHNFIFRRTPRTLVELVANNGLNAGLVLPDEEWQASARHLTVAGQLTVRINHREVGAGGLWPLADGPDASVGWLRTHLRDHGLALAPGDLVLAGTPLGLYPVAPGDQVVVAIDGQPLVECRIASERK